MHLLLPHVWPLLPAHPRVVLILKVVKKLFSKQGVFVVHSKRFYKQNQILFFKRETLVLGVCSGFFVCLFS